MHDEKSCPLLPHSSLFYLLTIPKEILQNIYFDHPRSVTAAPKLRPISSWNPIDIINVNGRDIQEYSYLSIQKLPHIYDARIMKKYKEAPFEELSPHVLTVSDVAYRFVLNQMNSMLLMLSSMAGSLLCYSLFMPGLGVWTSVVLVLG